MIRALIVEDSRLAREDLKLLLRSHPDIEITGEAGHPDEALKLINKDLPDLIFLDINMPGQSGFDLIKQLNPCPKIIFTTAYSDYAVHSFEYNTVDYLLKPITPERLAKALSKLSAQQNSDSDEQPFTMEDRIFVKDGSDCFLVELNQIRRLENCGNYTHVIFADKKPLIYKSLTKIEPKLPQRHFFRANRQLIINLQYVTEINEWSNGGYQIIMTDDVEVEVSRRNANQLKTLLSL